MRWAIIVPVGGLARHHRQAVHPALRLQLRHHQPVLLAPARDLGTPIDFLGDDRWTMFSMVARRRVRLAAVHRPTSCSPGSTRSRTTSTRRPASTAPARGRSTGGSPCRCCARRCWSRRVLNIIYVFNSFPIIYTLNDRNPGFAHDTTITFMYKLAFKSAEQDVGMSAAAGVFNVLLILVVVAVYLRVVNWRKETADEPSTAPAPVDRVRPPAVPAAARLGAPAERAVARPRAARWRARRCRLPRALPRDAAGRAAPEQRRAASAADVPAARRGSGTPSAPVLSDERFLNWLRTSLIVATASTAIVLAGRDPGRVLHGPAPLPGRGASSCCSCS